MTENAFTPPEAGLRVLALTRPSWTLMLLRGLAGVLFGVIAIALPGPTLVTLALLFAAFMLVDGVFAIAAAFHAARSRQSWVWFALGGVADIVVAVIALAWPAVTIVAFVAITAAWALVSGVFMIIAAFRAAGHHGRWLLGLGGLISAGWGVLLLTWPVAGALTMVLWLGAYALVFGITFLVLAFRLHSQEKAAQVRPGRAAA